MGYRKRLITVLQEPDMDKRNVVYYGLALAIATSSLSTTENKTYGDAYIKAESTLYRINDLAIIEVAKVKNLIKSILRFKTSQSDVKMLVRNEFLTLESTLGVSELFSKDLIEGCQKYSVELNEAINTTVLYLEQ